MEGKGNLSDFVSLVTGRPHIALNIIRRLNVVDIVNCVKTSKGFRQLVFLALKWSQHFQIEVDKAASRLAITSGILDCEQHGPLQLPVEDYREGTFSWSRFSFGLDGSLWLFRETVRDWKTLDDYMSRKISIYDLDSKTQVNSIASETFALVHELYI